MISPLPPEASARWNGKPYKLFTASELSIELDVPESWLSAARRAGAPFPGGRSRPKWILAWLRANPEFTLKEFKS